jgi:hypothetical protein
MTGISATGALLAAGLHAAAGGSGFSRAVAGTGPVFLAFLAIHIPAGLARGFAHFLPPPFIADVSCPGQPGREGQQADGSSVR